MKDINDLGLAKDELSKAEDKTAVTEDNFSNAIDKTNEYSDKALDDELEMLAQTFRQELKKAQAMSEEELVKSGIVIQQYEDDDGVIPEEELCKCCGEQRRDKTFGENYEYCRSCREAMRRYPLSVPGIITLAAMVFIAVVSVLSFVADFNVYNTVREGDKYLAENKMYSALDSYNGAISAFEDKEILAKKLYLRSIKIIYNTMPDGVYSMSELVEKIGIALTGFEAQLPIYSDYEEIHQEAQVLYGTMNEFYNVLNDEKYIEYDFENEKQYQEVMTAIGSIIDKQVTVLSIDKKTSQLVSTSEAMVRFCQYMFAYSNGYYDDSYQYMNAVYEIKPQYLWLYAYELGMAELQRGDTEKAELLADVLYNNNAELPDAYSLKSTICRLSGNTRQAIEWADKGLAISQGNSELYRTKAMALVVKGDYEKAKEAVDTAFENDAYGLLCMTAIVIENELGNDERVKELKDLLKENNVALSEKTKNYLKGKISAQEMFTEGTGDVE